MSAVARGALGEAKSYRRRVILATSIGNALEWFDFIIYGFLAVTMASLFFPAADEVASLLLTFGTFGVTFLMRPLGAVVIGAYADRRGRKAALTLTILLMTLGTAMMAVTPTYGSIGIWAPAVVIVARILQSLSVGGEYGAATAFLVEQDPKHRGFLASWQYASQSLTTILAAGFGAALNIALTPAQLIAGGWRIPPPTVAYFGGLLTGAIQLLLIPLVGLLSDRYGRTLMPLGAAVAILLLIYPLFAWLVAVPALSTLLAVQAVLGLLNALYLGCQGGLIAELFPSRVLGSGLAIGNALAVTIFGGFAPFIGVWLIETTGNPLAPSFYLMFGAAVSIVALTALRRPRFSRIEE